MKAFIFYFFSPYYQNYIFWVCFITLIPYFSAFLSHFSSSCSPISLSSHSFSTHLYLFVMPLFLSLSITPSFLSLSLSCCFSTLLCHSFYFFIFFVFATLLGAWCLGGEKTWDSKGEYIYFLILVCSLNIYMILSFFFLRNWKQQEVDRIKPIEIQLVWCRCSSLMVRWKNHTSNWPNCTDYTPS